MPIPQTETILKSYFETGDQPNQAQFAELIGTMFYLFQQAMDAAETAQDDAASALARQPQALVKATYPGSGSSYTVDAAAINISSITVDTSGGSNAPKVRVTWTTPFSDATYRVFVSPFSAVSPRRNNVEIVAITQAYVELRFTNENAVTPYGVPAFNLVAFI